MTQFSKKLKKIFNYLDPFYEITNKINDNINRLSELNKKMDKNMRSSVITIGCLMSDEERIEYKKNLLKEEANNIIDKLESNSELYKEYNNIMRRKKIKKLESNE